MTKPRLGQSQWVALIAAPVLSLVAFIVAYYVNPLDFRGRAAVAAIPAFLLAIVILLIGHNLAAFRELEKTASDSDRIYEAVKDYLHVTKVGTPETAIQYVLARLPILREVRNTSFNIREEIDRADDVFYETPTYTGLAEQVAEWTAKDVRWKDIGDPRAVERLRGVHKRATLAAGSRHSTHYQYRLIAHSEPQINFIILNYPDGTSEVLFNWDFRNIGQDPVVLLSRDRDIVEMFSIQFEYLWRAASPDHDTTAVRSTSKK